MRTMLSVDRAGAVIYYSHVWLFTGQKITLNRSRDSFCLIASRRPGAYCVQFEHCFFRAYFQRQSTS